MVENTFAILGLTELKPPRPQRLRSNLSAGSSPAPAAIALGVVALALIGALLVRPRPSKTGLEVAEARHALAVVDHPANSSAETSLRAPPATAQISQVRATVAADPRSRAHSDPARSARAGSTIADAENLTLPATRSPEALEPDVRTDVAGSETRLPVTPASEVSGTVQQLADASEGVSAIRQRQRLNSLDLIRQLRRQ